MTLYILKYNNYYNRLVKQENSLDDYMQYVVYQLESVNFNPNDFIYTEHIIGSGDYTGIGDYLLVADENGEIVSRWFILEAVRKRGGQFNLNLYRDTVADYYNLIIKSPMFIEKATIPVDNPLIFNSENMTYNQVKKSESLLKDKSGCPWLVGYYAKNATDIKGTVSTNMLVDIPAIAIDTPIINWQYYKYQTESFAGVPTSTMYQLNSANQSAAAKQGFYYLINADTGDTEAFFDSSKQNETLKQGATSPMVAASIEDYLTSKNLVGTLKSYIGAYAQISSQEQLDDLLSYNGQLIRDTNGEVYLVNIYSEAAKDSWYPVKAGNLFNELSTMATNLTFTKSFSSGTDYLLGYKCFSGSVGSTTFEIKVTSNTYRIGLTRQQQYEVKYDLTSSTKIVTEDAPYNLFAIPYGEVTIKDIVNNRTFTTSADIGLSTAITMQGLETTSNIYDIQLVPYCPVSELITDDKELTVTNGSQFSLITLGEGDNLEIKGIIFNVAKSTFSLDIPKVVGIGSTSLERKVNNECDKWRLSSPNYSNYFDFSVEKNSGIQFFNVDCSYKPFTPYIHINPNFGGLYGYDDNSPRGLVLGGDFSLSQVVNSWQEYQIQNKNFQNIFDRQIQNMEVNNKYQRAMEITSAITGTVSGGVAGAGTGLIASGGNPLAAAAGGGAGLLASGAGGIADVMIKDKLRNEAMDYTKDLFGYNLGNIQALPQTISKVSAFNANNKIFPVLEYYTATDVEKQALRDKIKYNGMTVMTIGKIVDYLQAERSYVKGQLIRMDDLGEDYHIINAIAGELNKGVYI